MDKQIFVTNLALLKKRKILVIRIALSILFVTLLTSVYMNKVHPDDAIRSSFRTFSLIGYGIVVYTCISAIQRLTRRLGLLCPQCNRSLSGPQSHRVVQSGNCNRCGAAIF